MQIKNKNPIKQELIDNYANELEEMCYDALFCGLSSMKHIVPEIIYLLCPIINAVFDRQCSEGLHRLHRRKLSNQGCWNSFLFIDGKTNTFHRENDIAYTMITVPKQEINRNLHPSYKPEFLFQINEAYILTVSFMNDELFFIMLHS